MAKVVRSAKPAADAAVLPARSFTPSPRRDSRSAFQERHRAEPTVAADADDRATTRGKRREFLDRLAQNARAGGGERMAERDAAAIRIHPLDRKTAEGVFDAGFGAHERLILQSLDVAGDLRR